MNQYELGSYLSGGSVYITLPLFCILRMKGDLEMKDKMKRYNSRFTLRLNEKQREVVDAISQVCSVSGKCISSDFSSASFLRLSLAVAVSNPDKYMSLLEEVLNEDKKYDKCFPPEKRRALLEYLKELNQEGIENLL